MTGIEALPNPVCFPPSPRRERLLSWFPCGRKPANMTVFCDLDGPLIDVSQRYFKTYQLAIAQTQAHYRAQGNPLQLTPLSFNQFWQLKQERIPDQDIAFLSGFRFGQIDHFLSTVREIVNQPILLSEDRLQPGVEAALATLHRWGVRLAVVTLRCQTQAVHLLQSHNLAHWFTWIRGTQDLDAAYANYADCKQALLAEVLAQSGSSSADQFWMIGDTEADVLAAQAVGISAIALTCGIRSHTYLQKLNPTHIHSDLAVATQFLLGVGQLA